MKASYVKYSVGDRRSISFVLLAHHSVTGVRGDQGVLRRKYVAIFLARDATAVIGAQIATFVEMACSSPAFLPLEENYRI
jgi:hypothetical protein